MLNALAQKLSVSFCSWDRSLLLVIYLNKNLFATWFKEDNDENQADEHNSKHLEAEVDLTDSQA